ncbi:AAA family ATPase [Rhizobium sp. NLR9a]|uniref:AAA family ATPase n=1 Tax=unclassified Rhizobium TaxID=2613769 RepID=UPI001C82B0A2|nr:MULTISPECIES: AAA family ATPase [unclassified Rhizobium]MBX5216493.1 AAA family ATPase [Rhizobium sp. NLR9a]MBX5277825.1 AAA family ATPase [Rhizobium sp. NLR13a]
MPITQSGKRLRVPWRKKPDENDLPITLPVFMAYCAVAGSLRAWNRLGTKTIVTLVTSEDFYYPVFAEAARFFASQIWHSQRFHGNVLQWTDKNFRHEAEALRDERAILFASPPYEIQDDDRLLSDAVVPLVPRTTRHAEAALRRAGLPITRESIQLLLTEPWARLSRAFQDRRDPLQAIQRLRRLPIPIPKEEPVADPPPPRVGPTLADMHGFGSLIEWGYDLAKDIADFRAGIIQWRDVDNGVLISGPPGVGKTMFASALANTCSVPIIYGSASRWQEAGALDEHLKALRASFDEARKKAPCILLFDEIDVLGSRGETDRNSAYMRALITAVLQLLDGFERREGVVVLGACNYPDLLDSALKRPGRLDRHIAVPLPDAASRRSILKFHSGVTMCSADLELFDLATEGLTGADIERLVRDAKRAARRQSERLNSEHIVSHLRPLIKLPEAYLHSLAVHEAGHAVVGFEVGHSKVSAIKISRYKIEGEAKELGYVEYHSSIPQRRIRTFYENAIAASLGGIAAELEVFGSFADGAAGADAADLNRATDLATALEGTLGMGHTLVVAASEKREFENLRLYLPELRRQVHDVLEAQLERARSVIRQQRPAMDVLVEQLLEAGELTGAEVHEIISRHRRPTVSLAKPPRRAGM